ncbi:SRPBCC domain-containing protein [Pedobacter sp. SYSU D00535]|uniref:SRPBCC family protein n=1 Tax=Pedobacter sp. SYSU D00535 TaxID=2810308 RepID=UPI001A95D2F0|nr:SRPBCC domain-containing protein [Pedobacter sp. SYSU D00535]
MELKTKIHAEEGKQDLTITRDFDLPLDLLFKAYEEPVLIEQWMGTKVLKLENKRHGSLEFETTDPKGNKHGFHGVIHEFSQNKRITRTYEMENTPFQPWLEFMEFEAVSENTSRLQMHVVYRSVEERAEILKMPFAQGINWAHNTLQEVVGKLKLA